MRGATSAKWVVGAIVVALAATACSGGDDKGSADAKGGVFRLGLTEPTAIDPFNAQESEGSLVAHNLFTGLYNVEPNGKLTAGARGVRDHQRRRQGLDVQAQGRHQVHQR